MDFCYKSRKNELPNNDKPSIFIYACPKDNIWHNKIIDLFLDAFDCGVYFFENTFIDVEANLTEKDFSRFSLLVILISENSINIDYNLVSQFQSIAKQTKTPIFFVRVSNIDFNDFETKHGSIHVFDATNIDIPTHKDSVVEHIRAKLFELFYSDIETNDIKNAFNAQIFLSYRKKDYRYLNSFLNLFHSIPLLRSVSVWYDDFLIPGKNYERSINDAMNDSPLFLLIVTNNLLEKGNYVLNIEYPFAIINNKIIFPFQFENIDKIKLQQTFPNLPNCIDASNIQEVKIALNKICEYLKLNVQENSPKQKYFLGLAYLLGVYVEKNAKISEELLSDSIENGYTEGLMKLGEMYAYGNGVSQDHKKAIRFLEKYIVITQTKQFGHPFKNYLENTPLSSEEYKQYLSLNKGISAVKLLVSLYKAKNNFNVSCFDSILSFIKSIVTKTSILIFLLNSFQNIIGYESIQGDNGKYCIGDPIYEEKKVVTAIMFDSKLLDTIHIIAFDFSRKFPEEKQKKVLQNILSIYEEAYASLTKVKDSLISSFSDPIKKLLSDIISICSLLLDFSVKEKSMGSILHYSSKCTEYQNKQRELQNDDY